MIFIMLMLLSNASVHSMDLPKRSSSAPARTLTRHRALSAFDSVLQSQKDTPLSRSLTEPITPPNCILPATGEISPLTPNLSQMPTHLRRFDPIDRTPLAAAPASANTQAIAPEIRFPEGYAITAEELKLLTTNQAQLLFEPRITINPRTLAIRGYWWLCVGFLLKSGIKKPLTKLDV